MSNRQGMRRILILLVAVAAPFAGACGDAEKVSIPETNIPRWDETEEYRRQRAEQRDRDICLNPLRRCQDMTPQEWDAARLEWEVTHP